MPTEEQPSAQDQPVTRPVTFYMTPRTLIVILSILSALALAGAGGGLAMVLAPASEIDVRARSLIAAVALGISGSAAYYLRRLYQAGFDNRLKLTKSGEQVPLRIATATYLLGRPIVAIPLSLAASMTAILTYTAVSPETAEPTLNLVYLCAGVGFVTGFLGGQFIGSLEKTGKL